MNKRTFIINEMKIPQISLNRFSRHPLVMPLVVSRVLNVKSDSKLSTFNIQHVSVLCGCLTKMHSSCVSLKVGQVNLNFVKFKSLVKMIKWLTYYIRLFYLEQFLKKSIQKKGRLFSFIFPSFDLFDFQNFLARYILDFLIELLIIYYLIIFNSV